MCFVKLCEVSALTIQFDPMTRGVVMKIQRMFLIIGVSLAAIAAGTSGSAVAHPGGGGGGGSHGGGGGFHGGGGYHGGGGFRGGGGYRGGWYGGGGYRRGWYGGGYYGAWGELGYGLLFATLPWYYDTYWWDGSPYYYADDVYYQWNRDAAEYETVRPPPGLSDQVKAQEPVVSELFMYPKAGQTNEQQARDREDCHRWAVAQSGFDPAVAPTAPAGATTAGKTPSDTAAARRADYRRADRACLEGRNYSVE
jgi:hypothetical protein